MKHHFSKAIGSTIPIMGGINHQTMGGSLLRFQYHMQ